VEGGGTLLAALLADPLALYPAMAALLLASVALASGLMRGDAAALARPIPVAWLLAILAATAVAAATGAASDGVTAELLIGLGRLPLYLFALAYGPVPAMVAAALAGAYLPRLVAVPWEPYHLGLELVVIGWLAVWPSPRRTRWVGGLYCVSGYVLAAATVGITTIALTGVHVDLSLLLAHHGLVPLGVLVAALVLASCGPRTFDTLFPGAGIAPRDTLPPAPAPSGAAAEPARAGRSRPTWPAVVVPDPYGRAPRTRSLPRPKVLAAQPFTRRRR
jgi:hypothetical protein